MPEKTTAIYPYPAVQYIPLLTTVIMEGPWTPTPGLNRPTIIVGKNDPEWREYIQRVFGVTMPPLTLASGEVLVLALNLAPLDLKYRGNFVTVLADLAPGRYKLLRLNERLFYKERIIFEVYTQDATRVCWQPWDRVPKRPWGQSVV